MGNAWGTDVNVKICCHSGAMQVIIVTSAWQHVIKPSSRVSDFERNVVILCIYPLSNQKNHKWMAMDILGVF